MNMGEERQGGLRLCECRHLLSHHAERPAWYFHEGSSEAAKAAPMVMRCSHCDCSEPRLGAYQGYEWRMDPHSLKQ